MTEISFLSNQIRCVQRSWYLWLYDTIFIYDGWHVKVPARKQLFCHTVCRQTQYFQRQYNNVIIKT